MNTQQATFTGIPGQLPDGGQGVWTSWQATPGDKVFVEGGDGQHWCSILGEEVRPGLFRLIQPMPMPTQATTREIVVPFGVVVLALLAAWCLAIRFATTLPVWLFGVSLAATVDLTTKYSRESKHPYFGRIETVEFHPSAWVVAVAVITGIFFGGIPAVLVGAVAFFTKWLVAENLRSWWLKNHGEPK